MNKLGVEIDAAIASHSDPTWIRIHEIFVDRALRERGSVESSVSGQALEDVGVGREQDSRRRILYGESGEEELLNFW